MSWSLRIRGPSGQTTLNNLSAETTLLDLQQQIADKHGIAVARQELLAGFPPKVLQTHAAGTALLSSIGIANGDSLTVRETPAPATTASDPAPAAATSAAVSNAAADPVDLPGLLGLAGHSNGAFMGAASLQDEDEDAQLAAAIAASLRDTAQQPAQPAAAAGPANSTATGQTPAGKGPAPTSVQLPDGSCVVRRVIPSDNSCLFTAVGYVMEHDRTKAATLRRVIAEAVAADPVTFNEGFLGQENEEYQKWITNKDHWGGGIELAILSKHYGREIDAYDIQTKRCDRYGEQEGYEERVMLIYDGLHYDALAVAAFDGAPEDLDITVLQAAGAEAAVAAAGAERLVAACHEARQFTDISNFTLRCGVCQIGLKGEKEAVEHAKATGHQNFAEY